MLKLLKSYKKILIVLSFPYIYMLFVLIAPTEKAVTAPGGLTPVVNTISIDGVEFYENFNTVYVYSYYPVTAFQSFILDDNNDEYYVRPISIKQKDTSRRDDYMAGQISKLTSLQISIIKAYELAQIEDNSIEIEYRFGGLYITYRPSHINELQIGDLIIEIDGTFYLDVEESEFRALASQESFDMKIKRKVNQEFEMIDYSYIKDANDLKLDYYVNYEITKALPSFELPGLDSVIGGPSGGVMQTLSIYASLLKLNIGDLKIAGTGTIRIDGTIGRIGGPRQKIYTGIYHNVDIFFITNSHFNEVMDIDYDYILYPVSTIEEAVQKLHEAING